MTRKSSSSFRGKVAKDAAKPRRSGGRISYLRIPEGVKQFNIDADAKIANIDIMPYVVSDPKHPDHDDDNGTALVGDLWYKRPIKVHRNIGVKKESCICPTSVGKRCPICEYQKELFDKDTEDDREDAIALYPTERNLYNVIPLDSEKFKEVVAVWDMSEKLFQEELKDSIAEDDSREVFPDLKEGLTLELHLKWKKLGKNKFPETKSIEFNERETVYDKSIMEDVVDLDTILVVYTYKELKAKFFELDDEEEGGSLKDIDDDDDDDKPARKKKRPSKDDDDDDDEPVRKKKRPAKDEDEDEDEDEDDEPVRKKKRPAKDEDDDEDDDDDDDKPVRKKKRPVEDEDDEEDDDEDDKPSKTKSQKKTSGKMKCPFDHKFGTHFEKYDDCDDCELYDSCYEESRKL